MTLERKKTLNVFRDAREAFGSYDDFPVGQPGVDPMPHLSRNRVAQPFWQVSEADQVLIQMAGRGAIEFRASRMTLEPGDTVYIPACTPSRLVPDGEVVQLRLKAEPAVREAVAFYCACGAIVSSTEIAAGLPARRVSRRGDHVQRERAQLRVRARPSARRARRHRVGPRG